MHDLPGFRPFSISVTADRAPSACLDTYVTPGLRFAKFVRRQLKWTSKSDSPTVISGASKMARNRELGESGRAMNSPLFRRGVARLGISWASARQPVITTNAEHSCRREGAEGTMPSALEGNCRRCSCLAGGARTCPRPRAVRECGGRRHDTSRFRIRACQTRVRRSEGLPLFARTLRLTAPTSTWLCAYDAVGYPRHQESGAVARSR